MTFDPLLAAFEHAAVLYPEDPGSLQGGHQVEWVSLRKLWPYREFDHDPHTGISMHIPTRKLFHDYAYTPEKWHELKRSIGEGGLNSQPIKLEYHPDSRTMHIGEGNHGMRAAHDLGHDMVPVWGLKTEHQRPGTLEVPGEPRVKRNQHGYFPSSFRPSDVLPEDWMMDQHQRRADYAHNWVQCPRCLQDFRKGSKEHLEHIQHNWHKAFPPVESARVHCPDCYMPEDEHRSFDTLYHSARTRNRESIARHGLHPFHDPEDFWEPGVYMSPKPANYPDEDTWEVDTRGLRLHPDEPNQQAEFRDLGGSHFAKDPIGPERLKLVHRGVPGKYGAREKPTKTKVQVNYRPATGPHRCGNCVMIRMLPPDFESFHCTLVKGLIEETDTCDEWSPAKKHEGAAEQPERRYYLRFGDWDPTERSRNHVTGDREHGVSVYDLDQHGNPLDPDPDWTRSEDDPEQIYGNDTAEEMHARVRQAERDRASGTFPGDERTNAAHIVTGDVVGIGHDAEPLLHHVKRVGDWMDHRHLFFPHAEKHRLARDESDDEYEPPRFPPHHASKGERYVSCDQGHSHWGEHGAAGLLIRHRGKDGQHRYLLQKRAPFTQNGDSWSTPGGALHEGEDSYAGARREAAEEIGRLPRMRRSHQVRDDHGGWSYTTHVCDIAEPFEPDRSSATTGFETAGHGWFTADEMKHLDLHPGFAKTWDTVRRSRTDKTAAVAEGPFYHGSKYQLHPGDYLTVPQARHHAPNYSESTGRHVFFTNDKRTAVMYAEPKYSSQTEVGHVYEVQPTSRYGHDPAESVGYSRDQSAYRTDRRLKVIRELGPEDLGDEDWERLRTNELHPNQSNGYSGGQMWHKCDKHYREGQFGLHQGVPAEEVPKFRHQAAIEGHGLDPFGMAMHGLTGEDAAYMRDVIDHIRRGAPPSEPINDKDAAHMARGFRMRDRLKEAGFDTSPSEKDKYPRGVNIRLPEGHGATLSPNEPQGWHVRTYHPADHFAEHIHHDLPDSDEDFPAALHRYYASPQIQEAMTRQRWSIGKQASLDPLVQHFGVSGYTGLTSRSGMISIDMHPDVSRQLAVPGGVDDHHITLVYLGKDVSDEAYEEACRRAQEAASRYRGPVPLKLEGTSSFEPSASSDDKRPVIIPVKGPAYLRQMREELADLSKSEHTNWKPHVTLGYVNEGEPWPHFDGPLHTSAEHVSVHRGDEVRHFPFGR